MVLGVSPLTVGLVLALARLWDAFVDPLMDTISDNARTRWGRRKPFIVAGAALCGLTFPFVWSLPTRASGTDQFVWLAITMVCGLISGLLLPVESAPASTKQASLSLHENLTAAMRKPPHRS